MILLLKILFSISFIVSALNFASDAIAHPGISINYIDYASGQIISIGSETYTENQITDPHILINPSGKIDYFNNSNQVCISLDGSPAVSLVFADPKKFEEGKTYNCGGKFFHVFRCVNFGSRYCRFSTIYVKDSASGKYQYSYDYSECRGIVSYSPYYEGLSHFILSGRFGIFADQRMCGVDKLEAP